MKLPITFGGKYAWTLRNANTNEIFNNGEQHNLITLTGWKTFLTTEFSPTADLIDSSIILSEDTISESESIETLATKVVGTTVNPTVVNFASAGVPKNFIFHFQFPVPEQTKTWKTIALEHNTFRKCITVSSLETDLIQLGNDSPTPQILDLYYTLYFEFDASATIEHSMNGGSILENFVDIFSERKISDYTCALFVDPYATLAKTMSAKFSNYLVPSAKPQATTTVAGTRQIDYAGKTKLDISNDLVDVTFKRKATLNMTNASFIGNIFGSVGVAAEININTAAFIYYGIYWPITKNVNVRPIQNVFSHKPDSTTPFEYSFRSTGKLVFDDTQLDLGILPSWYKINFYGNGNAADDNVKITVKRTDMIGLPGNNYFNDIFYNFEGLENPIINTNVCLAQNIPFVYSNALFNSPNIDNMKFCYSLYNGKEVIWFDTQYVIKQNLINANYEMIRNGTPLNFVATAIHQLAIVSPPETAKTIFIACRETGIWRLAENFSTVTLCDVSGISGVENKCYGIHVGYNNRVWALMEGGLIYSDNLGNTWLASTCDISGITDSSWHKVQKLYAGSGTNDGILLFVVDGGEGEYSEYIWYKQSTNTKGITARATGFVNENGPKQILAVPNWNCFLAKKSNSADFFTFSYNVVYSTQTTNLGYNTIDVLFDENQNYFVVHQNSSFDRWLVVNDSYTNFRLSVLAPADLLTANITTADYYKTFALMSRRSPIVFQGGTTTASPRFAGRIINPDNYKCRVLDLIYDDWRFNLATNQLALNYVTPAIDLTLNSFSGKRINFAVNDIAFKGGTSISVKPYINQIRNKLITSGECTIALMVRPTQLLPDNSNYHENVKKSSILSLLFDANKERVTTGAVSLQINPTVKLTGYSSTNVEINHVFRENTLTTGRMFDVNKVCRVVLTITPNSIKFYVNGLQIGLECMSCVGLDFAKLSDIIIGQSFVRSFGFIGYIDYIQIWDKIFTADDVAFDYQDDLYLVGNASNVHNPSSSLAASNLIAHYKLVDQLVSMNEAKTIDPVTIFNFANGLKLKFEDNTSIATSFFDKDFYTFGVVDGMLKDNQIIFGEDYYLTFVR